MVSKAWITGISMVVWAASMGGCSAAPGEASDTESQALGKCGAGGCGGTVINPPLCDSPRLWPYAYEDSTFFVCRQAEEYIYDWRGFNGSAFEAQLVTLGCNYQKVNASARNEVRASLDEPDASLTGGTEGFSLTACPAGCAINNLVASYVNAVNTDGTPVNPYLAESPPSSCDPDLPAGLVYVEWDPHCPGGCPVDKL